MLSWNLLFSLESNPFLFRVLTSSWIFSFTNASFCIEEDECSTTLVFFSCTSSLSSCEEGIIFTLKEVSIVLWDSSISGSSAKKEAVSSSRNVSSSHKASSFSSGSSGIVLFSGFGLDCFSAAICFFGVSNSWFSIFSNKFSAVSITP